MYAKRYHHQLDYERRNHLPMSKKCKTTFILKEFHENKSIELNLHVDSTPGPHCYDMIIGRNVMGELGISLNFEEQTMFWDDSTIKI